MKRTKKTTPEPFSLVGRFFHSIKPDGGEIEWQGRVLGRVKEGLYLVQLKSWVDGSDTDQVFASLDEMRSWKFYASADDMNGAYEKVEARAGRMSLGHPHD